MINKLKITNKAKTIDKPTFQLKSLVTISKPKKTERRLKNRAIKFCKVKR